MAAIGIDTHKATLAVCAVDDLGAPTSERTFANDAPGHGALATWAAETAAGAVIGVEGSSSFGAPLARFLVGRGFAVREVPPQLSHREPIRTPRAGKSDPGDALAIARVTARETDLPPVRMPDKTTDIALLVEAREDVVAEMIRVRNRLHADLRVLVPGYGANVANPSGNPAPARRGETAAGPAGRPGGTRSSSARAPAGSCARGTRPGRATRRVHRWSSALELAWGGPLVTAKLIGEAGDVSRFRSTDAFAALAGVAPIPASSGQTSRMRLNRGGNRQINRALYSIALAQAWHHPPAKAYIARKRAEGKTWREAIRCLKRQLVRPVFRLLKEGAESLELAA